MKNILNRIDKLKAEINEIKPLDKHSLNQVKEYYRIGFTYTSNALEGNSLTESETKIVIEDGITIGGKPLRDHLEVLGHSEAYDSIYKISKNNIITESDIKKLHKLFYYRIDKDNAGKYRKDRVFISGSKYPLPNPPDIPSLMKGLISKQEKISDENHPVVYAALMHKEFVFIHPFTDGNGRLARLLMNLILLHYGYNIAIIPPVVRNEYINALEKAHTNDKDFITFIAQMVWETQKDYIRLFLNA